MESQAQAPEEPRTAAPRAPAWLPAAVAALLAPGFLVVVKDYDVWWHMATGRWIVQHGRLPTTDPFTYTMVGKPWHLVNGLADLVFYGAYQLGGSAGLVLLKAACAWVTLTLVGLCLREVRVSRGGIVGLLMAVAVLLQARYSLDRPLILGAALLAGCQLAALRSHRRRDRSHGFFLVALPLWPLVHATALLGVVQLGALLAAAILARSPWARPPSPPAPRHLRSVAMTFVAAIAVSAALPWWRDAISVATSLAGGATATLFTAEWSSGAEDAGARVGHWALIAVALAGGVRRFREDASLLLLTLVAAALSFKFARNAYEAVILAAPACACALLDAAARMRAMRKDLLADALVPVSALALAVLQFAAAPVRTVNGPFGFGVEERMLPTDTLVTLRELPVHRLFNDFPIGGFLLWQGGPYGVYCDGRTVSLYTEADVQRLFVPMIADGAALTRTADAWDAVYGLNQNLSPPNQWMMISPDWVPLHLGHGTALFVRSTHLSELPPGIRPLHLLRFSGDARWTEGWYDRIVKDPARRAELAEELAVAAHLSPDSPTLVNILRAVAALDPPYAAALAQTLEKARAGD